MKSEWIGLLVRIAAEIDTLSRMVTVVARIVRSLRTFPSRSGCTHAAGHFIEAEIEGREVVGAIVLPSVALRGDGRVFVVDSGGRLRFRNGEVLRNRRNEIVVSACLRAGRE